MEQQRRNRAISFKELPRRRGDSDHREATVARGISRGRLNFYNAPRTFASPSPDSLHNVKASTNSGIVKVEGPRNEVKCIVITTFSHGVGKLFGDIGNFSSELAAPVGNEKAENVNFRER